MHKCWIKEGLSKSARTGTDLAPVTPPSSSGRTAPRLRPTSRSTERKEWLAVQTTKIDGDEVGASRDHEFTRTGRVCVHLPGCVRRKRSKGEKRRVALAGQSVKLKTQGERKTMRHTQFFKCLLLFSLMILLLYRPANAQSIVTGAVSGTVTDASGAVVTDAKVTLVNEATQESKSNVTGATGTYQFALLEPGNTACPWRRLDSATWWKRVKSSWAKPLH